MNHPSIQQLSDFIQGRLAAEEQLALESHIESCDQCCESLRRLPGEMQDSVLAILRQPSVPTFDSQAFDAGRAWFLDTCPVELLTHPKFQILERLGSGGMGSVYKARHRMMKRMVAIKVISPLLLENTEAVARFQREVKVAAQLKHPQIVVAYDAQQVGNTHFLVMEYIDGMTLAERIQKDGPLPIVSACRFISQTASGLAFAGQRGLIHRDIKPQNLMLTQSETVKILDFGLARINNLSLESGQSLKESLTKVSSILGTPDYIAPEQVSNPKNADSRSDIYSLGCTFYFLLTGRPPFPHGSNLQKALARLAHDAEPIQQLRSDVPDQVASIIQQMLARQPDDRFQSASDVEQVLEEFLTPVSASVANRPLIDREPQENAQHLTPRAHSIASRLAWIILLTIGITAVIVASHATVNHLQQSQSGPTAPPQPMLPTKQPVVENTVLGFEVWNAGGETHGTIDVLGTRLVITPQARTSLIGDGHGPVVYKDVTGDFSLTVDVSASSREGSSISPKHLVNLAGITVSYADGTNWIFAGLGRMGDGNSGFVVADSPNNSFNFPEPGLTNGQLRLIRFGKQLQIHKKSQSDSTWISIGDHRLENSEARIVLAAGCYLHEADMLAEFRLLQFETITKQDGI